MFPISDEEKKSYVIDTNGLYYKHVTIVIDDSSIISKWSLKFIDGARVFIYDHNMFIIQAIGISVVIPFSSSLT